MIKKLYDTERDNQLVINKRYRKNVALKFWSS